jgi:hypothetical protein
MKIYLTLTFIITASHSMAALNPPVEKSVFDKVVGFWGIDKKDSKGNCEGNPHQISFNNEHSEAYFKWNDAVQDKAGVSHQTVTYTINSHSNNTINMQIVGETRLDKNGNLVKWDLIYNDGNKYSWHRNDWPKNGRTASMIKCIDQK